jgi:hypothetical protein
MVLQAEVPGLKNMMFIDCTVMTSVPVHRSFPANRPV